MKLKLFAGIAVLAAVFVFGGLCHANLTTAQITSNSHEDSFPQIKGDYLVWQGYVGGDWEIFLYNVTTGERRRITENNYNDMSPQTDGNYVVWEGFNRTGGEIFLYHISNGRTEKITNDNNLDSSPQIANGRVVWTSREVTDSVAPGEILLYEIGTGTVTALSASVDPDGTLDDSFPRINDTEVAWVQTEEDGDSTFFIHYFGGTTGPAPDGYGWEDIPQTDGNLTALTRHDGSDREIFIYDSDSKSYHQITNNNLEEGHPSISGNYVVWVGGEGEASEIYLAFDETDTSSDGGGGGGGGLCFISTAVSGSSTNPCSGVFRCVGAKLLFGFLLVGFVVSCLSLIRGRSVPSGRDRARVR